MRILHVIAAVADAYGGPPRVVRQMCRSLAGRGHEVTLITTDAAFGERLNVALDRPVYRDGYTTFYAPCRVPTNPHVAPELIWRVARMAPRFDIAHVHGLFNFPATLSQLVLRMLKRRYVVRPCGLLNRYGLAHRGLRKRVSLALLERANLSGAAFIQASTEPERDDLVALGFDRVEVVPQGVEIETSEGGASPLDWPYVLFMGRIAEVKGLPRLVRAFARLDQADLRLVLAGPDEYGHRAEVMRVAEAVGVSDRVIFPGMITRAEKGCYLAHARAFALVSDSESFGVAAVEAALSGLPLVVTTGVGIANEVIRAAAGVVVEPTVEAIAVGLAAALAQPVTYAEGARRLGAQFGWDHTAERLETLYDRSGST